MENQKSKKIKKGDRVVAIAGNFKGQVGTVLTSLGDTVIVQGVNVRKKHVKKSQTHPQGGIIEIEKPIHISNIAPCTEDGKPVKLKVNFTESGDKELVYRDGEVVKTWRTLKTSKKR